MRILALDLATKVGWACGDSAGEPTFGTKVLPSTGEDIGRFADAFDVWLRDTLALEAPQLVVFEAPILTSGRTPPATARKLMGLGWHTEFACLRASTTCREGHLQSVKKFFAGHGRADKDAMKTVARRYGWQVRTDDEADALALWAFTVHKVAPQHAARFKLGPMGAAA